MKNINTQRISKPEIKMQHRYQNWATSYESLNLTLRLKKNKPITQNPNFVCLREHLCCVARLIGTWWIVEDNPTVLSCILFAAAIRRKRELALSRALSSSHAATLWCIPHGSLNSFHSHLVYFGSIFSTPLFRSGRSPIVKGVRHLTSVHFDTNAISCQS